jgi:hypothetical protein
MSKLLLDLDLVPSSSWFNNVRTIVSQKQWDYIKKQAYYMCEICGGTGPKHPVECHEIWSFNDKKLTQKLINMIALCPDCHMVKHMGFARVQNKEAQAIAHFKKINKLTKKEAEDYINKSFQLWQKRSEKIWKLDISVLESYGIDITKLK